MNHAKSEPLIECLTLRTRGATVLTSHSSMSCNSPQCHPPLLFLHEAPDSLPPLYPPPYIHDYRCEAGEEAVNCHRCMLHHISTQGWGSTVSTPTHRLVQACTCTLMLSKDHSILLLVIITLMFNTKVIECGLLTPAVVLSAPQRHYMYPPESYCLHGQ